MDRPFPRKVLLAVSGGIAAYKTPALVRALVKAGAQVRVVLSPAAHDFVAPLALATVSGHPALTDLVERTPGSVAWNDHVHLARWADLFLVAPATANTLAKMVHGHCDNLLLACYQSVDCPVAVAPAMDLEMFREVANAENLRVLQERGVHVIGPESGELASGLQGQGRMTEPEVIVADLVARYIAAGPLSGKRILITAGPTQEAIDPVRYIGNRSTGRMGFALAEEAAARGAQVDLVAGPVALSTDSPAITRHNVVSAADMAATCKQLADVYDVAIMSAAVADWRPVNAADTKIKKTGGSRSIELEGTEDILHWLGHHKRMDQRVVGFALETNDALAHAQGKLERKKADMIVLNTLEDAGAGFGHDTNKVTFLRPDTDPEAHPLMQKSEVARAILDRIERLL